MKPVSSGKLSQEEKKYLLGLVKRSLHLYVQKNQILRLTSEEVPKNLREHQACFVTYHQNGELRGCIGSILPSQPLYLEVIQRAIDAAVHDPRFPPITPIDLPDVQYEISVLSIPQTIPTYEDFIPGEHGIILSKYGRQAVFLPQVATEQGWDRSQTLTHLAVKAGLPANSWKASATFQIFTAEVFSEKII